MLSRPAGEDLDLSTDTRRFLLAATDFQ